MKACSRFADQERLFFFSFLFSYEDRMNWPDPVVAVRLDRERSPFAGALLVTEGPGWADMFLGCKR